MGRLGGEKRTAGATGKRHRRLDQLVGIDFTAGPWPDSGAVGSSSLGLFLNFVGWGWRQQRRASACAITACTTYDHVLPELATSSPLAISIPALADSLHRKMPTWRFAFFRERNSPSRGW